MLVDESLDNEGVIGLDNEGAIGLDNEGVVGLDSEGVIGLDDGLQKEFDDLSYEELMKIGEGEEKIFLRDSSAKLEELDELYRQALSEIYKITTNIRREVANRMNYTNGYYDRAEEIDATERLGEAIKKYSGCFAKISATTWVFIESIFLGVNKELYAKYIFVGKNIALPKGTAKLAPLGNLTISETADMFDSRFPKQMIYEA